MKLSLIMSQLESLLLFVACVSYTSQVIYVEKKFV